VLEVEPKLIDEYVRTGALRIISRPLLQSGYNSLRAAHATACAGDQQQYFAMRTLIYANIGMLYTAQDIDIALSDLAGQITLDRTTFDSCMTSNRHEQLLYEGFARAKNDGVQTRPVFDINDTRIIGGRSYADFVTVITALQP
jgi:protein-disulfide isomerase